MITIKKEISSKMREKIAKTQHDIWAHWMKYLFSCCDVYNGIHVLNSNKVRRWKRQMETPYNELTEAEKESDREQADKILKIL